MANEKKDDAKFEAIVYFNKGAFKDVPTKQRCLTRKAADMWVKHTLEVYEADETVSMVGVKPVEIREL